MTPDEMLDVIDTMVADDADRAYESILEAGRAARERGDETAWLVGDLAMRVGIKYGENRLRDFATEAGYATVTVRAYRKVSATFPKNVRNLFGNITFSHYRYVLNAVGDDGDIEEALDYLKRASDDNWSVDYLRQTLAREQGKVVKEHLLDAYAKITAVNENLGIVQMIMEKGLSPDKLKNLRDKLVRVVMDSA